MSPPPKIIKAVNFQARRAEQRSLSFLALVMLGPLFQIDGPRAHPLTEH